MEEWMDGWTNGVISRLDERTVGAGGQSICSNTYSKDIDDNAGKKITLLDPVDRPHCVFS